jgi:VIT1/CCC1 family predicted Fe2+/Mn2+ transporter
VSLAVFVEHMMQVELGMMVPDDDDNPWMKGAVTFFAFMAFGAVPIAAYAAFAAVKDIDEGTLFGICILFTGLAIFALGAVKGSFAQSNIFASGALMLVNGGLAAAASFLIGWLLEDAIDMGDE